VSKQFDATIALQLDIFRASEGVSQDVIKILRTLEKELIGKIASDDLTEWGRARVNKQLKEAQALIERYYDRVAIKSIGDTDDIARVAASVTASSLGAAAVIPTAAVLDRIAIDAVIQGSAQGAWWKKQAADVQFKFAGAVRQGLAAAETNQQIVARVREVMDVSKRNAATLVQTSTATIANDARAAAMEANDDLIVGYRGVATLDSKTCLTCAPLDGLEWTKAGAPIGHKFPLPSYPLHMNCLTGDALVTATNDVTSVSKRWYDGDVIVIKTAANRELTCTPNHPILTGSGWIAAGALDIGNDVISKLSTDSFAAFNGDHQNVPATIHDFSESFVSAGKVSAMPVPMSGGDFHGDGIGSDVAVVYSKRLLGNGLNTPVNQHGIENIFVSRLANSAGALFGLGGGKQSGKFGWLTPSGVISSLGELLSLFGGSRCHSCGLLLAGVSGMDSGVSEGAHSNGSAEAHNFSYSRDADARIIKTQSLSHINADFASSGADSGSIEPADDGVNIDAKLASDLLAGSAGSVARDKIINIERKSFVGHVYNLETDKGWYVANGIITHNCRCSLLGKVIDGEPGGTRASTDGQVSASLTFEGWLERQPIDRQNDILGKGRAELYRKGTITLQDLVSGRGRPLTIEQLKSRYT
jgi:SPP1 gp7 family putative phage head morphogenesis protein